MAGVVDAGKLRAGADRAVSGQDCHSSQLTPCMQLVFVVIVRGRSLCAACPRPRLLPSYAQPGVSDRSINPSYVVVLAAVWSRAELCTIPGLAASLA